VSVSRTPPLPRLGSDRVRTLRGRRRANTEKRVAPTIDVVARDTTTDGPFAESEEVIGGWAILQADTKAEILRLTTEFMDLHRKYWPEFEGECEVRPIEFQAQG
jgi:hypothetical protein